MRPFSSPVIGGVWQKDDNLTFFYSNSVYWSHKWSRKKNYFFKSFFLPISLTVLLNRYCFDQMMRYCSRICWRKENWKNIFTISRQCFRRGFKRIYNKSFIMTTGHWPVANKQFLLFFKRNLRLTMFIKHRIIDISRTFFSL